MKYVVVSGSHRENSQSSKIAQYLSNELINLEANNECTLIDLANNPLPLWDQSVWSGGDIWKEKWAPIAEDLQAADGFVFVVPEWAGMVPPGFKNFMLLCSNQELGHKPVVLASVSSSRNGAYPIAELRMTAGKNNHAVFLPDHLIVRNVENVLNEGDAKSEEDSYIRSRAQYSLKMLCQYSSKLKEIRNGGVVDFEAFGNGM